MTTFAHPLSGVMDTHGMLPADWPCLRCGKPLNADGNHPAELYAGTWNGLCYPCTKAGPYVEAIATLDGLRKLSYPPHLPSWRRDREHYYGYPDCSECHGTGTTGRHDWGAPVQCSACLTRWTTHPVRVSLHEAAEALRTRYEEAFQAILAQVLGLKRGASQKARKAAIADAGKHTLDAVRGQVLASYEMDKGELDEQRAWADPWRKPGPEEVLP